MNNAFVCDNRTVYEMTSCKTAQSFAGADIKCNNCPFNDCIYGYPASELKVLKYARKAITVFKAIECQIPDKQIISQLQITPRQLKYWKQNCNTIKSRINAFVRLS